MQFISKEKLQGILRAMDNIGEYYMQLESGNEERLGYCITLLNPEGDTYLQKPRFYDKWRFVKKYDEFARDKAKLSLKNKCSTLHIVQNPILFQHTNIVYPGGIYMENGYTIGVSGFKGVRDHAYGLILKSMLEAESRVGLSQWEKDNPDSAYLI